MNKNTGYVAIAAILCMVLGVLMSIAPPDVDAQQAAVGGESSGLRERLDGLSPQEQVVYLKKARSEGRYSVEASFFLGIAYFTLGEMDSAVVYYNETLDQDSTFSRVYVNLAIALENLGRVREAATVYERALAQNPRDVLAMCHLGYQHYRGGDRGKAMEYYNRALEIDPNSAQARYNLGLAFAEARIFKEAIREWKKVVELQPDSELGKTAAENVGYIEHYLELDERHKSK